MTICLSSKLFRDKRHARMKIASGLFYICLAFNEFPFNCCIVDPCSAANNPCLNGGACVGTGETTADCTCVGNFAGPTCASSKEKVFTQDKTLLILLVSPSMCFLRPLRIKPMCDRNMHHHRRNNTHMYLPSRILWSRLRNW